MTPGVSTDRDRGASENAHESGETTDAAAVGSRLRFSCEVRQPQVGFGEVARCGQRQAITGRPGDKIERCSPVSTLQKFEETRRVGERFTCWPRLIEKQRPVLDPAQIDAGGTGVDPDHTGHGLAIYNCQFTIDKGIVLGWVADYSATVRAIPAIVSASST